MLSLLLMRPLPMVLMLQLPPTFPPVSATAPPPPILPLCYSAPPPIIPQLCSHSTAHCQDWLTSAAWGFLRDALVEITFSIIVANTSSARSNEMPFLFFSPLEKRTRQGVVFICPLLIPIHLLWNQTLSRQIQKIKMHWCVGEIRSFMILDT